MRCSRLVLCSFVALLAVLGSHLTLAQSNSAAAYSGNENAASTALADVDKGLQVPTVSLSPTSLNFGNEALHKISAPQYVTLSNTGAASLTISSISSTSNNYSQSNNCPISPNTLPANGSCVITVRFTPSAAGTRTGSITITDNAAGSPQTISLTGNGVASIVTLSSTDIIFATVQQLGTTSAPKTVKLTNTSSTVALNISAIAINGDFALVSTTDPCPASGTVPAKTSCNLAFHFSPTAAGTRYGTITITDSDASSPNVVGLIGTGTAVKLSATTLNFASVAVGQSSKVKTVTMSNVGSMALSISGITIGGTNAGDYSQVNTCGSSLSAGANCAIKVTFKPAATGTRAATISIADSDATTPQTIAMTGIGTSTGTPLSVTTTSLAAGVVGTSYSQTLQATGGTTPYSWSIAIGSLPAGLTLNAATGAITGTPTGPQVGTISFTATVTDAEKPAMTASANLSIAISAPPLSVTTSSLPGGTLGSAYSQTLAATGGITPYTWSITTGALPAGLTLNASTGVISGTPTGTLTGPINFTVTVTDSESPVKTASANLSISISAPPLSVTTTSLAAGVVGTPYSQTLQATGGIMPYSWAITSGSLPAGLTLNAATGAITGTPTGPQVGTNSFTVTVTDSENPVKTSSANLSISISVPALAVSTSSLVAGVVGTSYSQNLQATGGITPYSWAITTGSLPAGLTLNAATGAITGKPTGPQVGTNSFTVTVTDSESPVKTASANLSISISAPPLSVTTPSLPGGAVGVAYSQTLAATGGITPYTWSITSGSLPSGLSLNTNGQITGTATATGTSNFSVKVTDSETPTAQSATANLSITISNPLQIITSGLPVGVVDTPYPGDSLSASGGNPPDTWSISAGNLPPGLSLAASTGMISGTPTQTGTFNFTAQVTDSTAQTATANLSITVNAALAITTTTLPSGNVGAIYSETMQAAGGMPTYSWSITKGSLPAGLSLNSITGQIYGTPTATGTSSFTVTVTDSESPAGQASANLSILINKSTPLQVQTTGLPMGSEVTAYAATLYASGGVQPYSWSIGSGSLPGGLALNATSGAITGTPTATGAINFTVEVTDSAATHATANLTITVMTCSNNAAFNGTYAALTEGWSTQLGVSSVQAASVLSFVADGSGNVPSGRFDSNDQFNGPQSGKLVGAYCMGPNNLGLMTLTETVNSTSNTRTFAIALNTGNSSGRISYYDNSQIIASGPLRKQTTSAFSIGKLKGDYAFGFIGADGAGHRSGMAGEFNSDGKGHLNGIADTNDNGTANSQITLTASNFTILSTSTGRGSVTITFNFAGGQTDTFIFYVVNTNEMLIMEDDPVGNGLLAGDILLQTGGGSFTDAALNGNSILGVQSVDNSSGSPVGDVTGGIFTANGSGSASLSFDDNHGGTLSTETGTGTYFVDSTGRVTLTGLGGGHPPVFYLISQNQGFVIGTDNAVAFGEFYPQTGSSFSNGSISGTFTGGSDYPEDMNSSAEVDSLTGDGAGNFTGVTQNDGAHGPQENAISTTYAVASSGRAVVSQGATEVGIMYIVSPTSMLFIPAGGYNGNNDPTLDWFAQ
ncbi:MAG: putative Ig domain-containing protein [Terriglobales bacterium]